MPPPLFVMLVLAMFCSPGGTVRESEFTSYHSHHNRSISQLYHRQTLYVAYPWQTFRGHTYYVNNPAQSFSVLPPAGGCGTISNIKQSMAPRHCVVATNAAFFDVNETHKDRCLGAVVSDGKRVHNSNPPNETHATFGIDTEGNIIVGYLNETDLSSRNWTQLVQGAFWVVKNGITNVEEALQVENLDFHTGGNPLWFRNLHAPRTSIGHDAFGRVMITVMDGNEINRDGATLDDLATFLIARGAVNAINLDGGGSSAVFEDGVLVNYPSDMCDDDVLNTRCARPVSVITCVHSFEWTHTPTTTHTLPRTKTLGDKTVTSTITQEITLVQLSDEGASTSHTWIWNVIAGVILFSLFVVVLCICGWKRCKSLWWKLRLRQDGLVETQRIQQTFSNTNSPVAIISQEPIEMEYSPRT